MYMCLLHFGLTEAISGMETVKGKFLVLHFNKNCLEFKVSLIRCKVKRKFSPEYTQVYRSVSGLCVEK